MLTVYGLKNCDTCRKALKWLADQDIPHRFHDVRADGIALADIKRFAKAVGTETLLNKASTTWRNMPKSMVGHDAGADALKLMVEHPTLIKRPVFENRTGGVVVGFREPQKAQLAALAGAVTK
ncbi:MAG: Spx/MgsR family RNA polymerase-binding regulatory protein [Parvibaculum sp.]|uniref:Spx/MgsR family RNA polymerase-binding regulatory protein n=1 Tax=Parvibaculum sp. TaxID=2024848 RepID=UPI00271A2E4E|nr:Spx/MgsR family RNA polymerase-binding regulatory protein [Parvibaculum sp.]MDO8837933.1 Spx/MgsR family RNA polymerase-binding regulatory protein [Parvibaculum sp.]